MGERMTERTGTPYEEFSEKLGRNSVELDETLTAIDNDYATALESGSSGDLYDRYLSERNSVINRIRFEAIAIGKDYKQTSSANSPMLPDQPGPRAAYPPPQRIMSPSLPDDPVYGLSGGQKTEQREPMFKPRFVLSAVGLAVAVIGVACGYLLPVGRYCTGAFSVQKGSREAPNMEAMAALTTCQINAKQLAPFWTAVIVVGLALFTFGLVWSLVIRARSAAAKRNRFEIAGAPAIATRRPDHARSTPIWPLLLGLAIIGGGIFLGYTVSVGPYCDGAFTQQTSAAGADIATAMNGKLSNYSDECRAAAGQQSVIYWGIIGFGGAVFVLGLVLQTVLGHRQSTDSRRGTIANELEHLARLLERGVLTHDEFAQQKEKLLGRG